MGTREMFTMRRVKAFRRADRSLSGGKISLNVRMEFAIMTMFIRKQEVSYEKLS
jgi:hypothetical protein